MAANGIHTEAASIPSLSCSVCGKRHTLDESEYTCTRCGPTGILEPTELPFGRVTELPVTTSPGMWRYERLLAFSPDVPRPPLPVGGTPLIHAGRLATALELPRLYIKNDSLNPTGSLKDRASALALARAAEIDARRVAVASTGNAGSSLAGLAASMGMPAAIFVPATAPRTKLIQALIYGAQVFAVQGSYDDAFELCLDACRHLTWYNRKAAYKQSETPGLTLEKTVAMGRYSN